MTVNAKYFLYSTDGCHLCDLARALVEQLDMTAQVSVKDIVDDDILVEAYGTTIPVLKDLSSGAELNWPFDAGQLSAFFTGH